MTQPLSNFQTRDIEALLHPYTDAVALRRTGPMVIDRAEGIRVYDQAGRGYIEALGGLWCCGLGFDNAELVEAAREQMAKLPYYHIFSGKGHEPAVELAEKIKEVAPGMARVFYQTSGSEANDTQIKFAWYYNNAIGRPQKKKIISRIKAYHGVTIVAASLTGLPNNHRDFDLPVEGIRHTATPHFWKGAEPGESEAAYAARLAAELDALIVAEGPDTVAAFIAEPVMGAGGVIVPPRATSPPIAAVCRKHDVLMISDEVICGFGRTGEWFGYQALDFPATSLSVAKQLTAGYLPLSAVALNKDMTEVIEANSGKIGTLGHGYTYGGHPVSCAVGVKTLGDLPPHRRDRPRAAPRPAVPGAFRPAGGAPARRRGPGARPDGRDRARAGQVAQGLRAGRQGRGALRAGADRPRGDRAGDRATPSPSARR